MSAKTVPRRARKTRNALTVLVLMLCAGGCASVTPLPMRAERYTIEVRLDPPTHRLTGRTAIDLTRIDQGSLAGAAPGPVGVEILLHRDLKITGLRAAGAELCLTKSQVVGGGNSGEKDDAGAVARAPGSDDEDRRPQRYRVLLKRPVEGMTLFVEYEGVLYQDVSAGEKAGDIHNFAMRAHIGTEGVYLANGYWYPQPRSDDDQPSLANYVLFAEPASGLELAASGRLDRTLSERSRRQVWRSEYPIGGMVLVGGPHQVHSDRHNEIDIRVHLQPRQAHNAPGLIAAVKRNLDRYEPLLGKYPGGDFSIVDNFFSSGFAFPNFTLLSSAVIDMGERAQITHGYLDHEMLHSWWGNGVHVDPRDGNWCEALASYGANYYGFVLDGYEDEARRKRRNYSHFFSRVRPGDDKPLGTYGRPNGCNRQIAYDKGAAVLHMLARKIGQDEFWAAIRKFNTDNLGAYASWEDLRRECEARSGMGLETFFGQWIRRSGAPQLRLEQARYRVAERTLTLALAQDGPVFDLDVPVRVKTASGTQDFSIAMRSARHEESIQMEDIPNTVELDPDYHVLRKIASDELIPTTALTRRGGVFAVVLPSGAVDEPYKQIQSIFESSFKDQQRIERTAGEIEEGALAERSSLILGYAVQDPYVEAFLSAIDFPVTFSEEGFEFEGTEYNNFGDAVLCTVHHPGLAGGGVTVVFASSEGAIPKAANVPMYEHSLVIFRNGRAVVRQDFEKPRLVSVERL